MAEGPRPWLARIALMASPWVLLPMAALAGFTERRQSNFACYQCFTRILHREFAMRGFRRPLVGRYDVLVPSVALTFMRPDHEHAFNNVSEPNACGGGMYVTCWSPDYAFWESGLARALTEDPSLAPYLEQCIQEGRIDREGTRWILGVVYAKKGGLSSWNGSFPGDATEQEWMRQATRIVAEHRGVDPRSLDLWHGVDPWGPIPEPR